MSDSGIEELMMVVLASEDMADEPELEGIIIDPMLCADTFAEVGQGMGIDPDALAGLPEEEREEIQMQILEESTWRLLTEELCQEILEGLNALRLRLKRAGRREEVAKAAAVQSFLRGDDDRESWPLIGVVQAIFHRSLMVGLELFEASLEVMEPDDLDEGGGSLLERLTQSSLVAKTDALLSKIPGVRGYLEKQSDKIWEDCGCLG